jgi:hypothetical protein
VQASEPRAPAVRILPVNSLAVSFPPNRITLRCPHRFGSPPPGRRSQFRAAPRVGGTTSCDAESHPDRFESPPAAYSPKGEFLIEALLSVMKRQVAGEPLDQDGAKRSKEQA